MIIIVLVLFIYLFILISDCGSGGTIKKRSVCAMNSQLFDLLSIMSISLFGREPSHYQSILWLNITYSTSTQQYVQYPPLTIVTNTTTVHGVLFLSIGMASNHRRTERERTDIVGVYTACDTHFWNKASLPLASFWCQRASCRLGVVIFIYTYISWFLLLLSRELDWGVLQFIMVMLY